MKVGVLALQGAFREHREVLDALGVEAVEVRTPERARRARRADPARRRVHHDEQAARLVGAAGAARASGCATACPVLGTCAGMILLAREVVDGRPDQESFGVIDVAVRRNAYGRQRDSFEADLDGRRPRRAARSPACSSARPASRRAGARRGAGRARRRPGAGRARARSGSRASIPSCPATSGCTSGSCDESAN